jgi:hypothetical protein
MHGPGQKSFVGKVSEMHRNVTCHPRKAVILTMGNGIVSGAAVVQKI